MASAGAAKHLYRLSVVNIPWTIGDLQLKQYFSQFGRIAQSKVLFDRNTGLSKHVAVVDVADKDTYESILTKSTHTLDGMDFYVRKWNEN